MPINATRSLSRTLSMRTWQLMRERSIAQQRGTAVKQSSAAYTNSAGAPTSSTAGSRRGVARCAVCDCRVESAHQACSIHCSSVAACMVWAACAGCCAARPQACRRSPRPSPPLTAAAQTQRHSKGLAHVRISYASAHEHSSSHSAGTHIHAPWHTRAAPRWWRMRGSAQPFAPL